MLIQALFKAFESLPTVQWCLTQKHVFFLIKRFSQVFVFDSLSWMYDWGGTFIHGSRRLCLQSAPLPLPLRAEAWVKDIWTLEAQEKQLRGKREELEVEAELAASRAKSEVFQAASEGSCSSWRPSNRTNTYLQRKEKQQFSCEGLKPGENSHSGHHVKLVKAMEVLKKEKKSWSTCSQLI